MFLLKYLILRRYRVYSRISLRHLDTIKIYRNIMNFLLRIILILSDNNLSGIRNQERNRTPRIHAVWGF